MFFRGWKPPIDKTPVPIGYGGGVLEYEFNPTMPEGTAVEKRAFAEALLRTPDDPMGAAIHVFGQYRGSHCYLVSTSWPWRDDIKAMMKTAIEEKGEEAFLPSKATVAREIYGIAKDRMTTRDVSLRAYNLYAEMLDMKPKKDTGDGPKLVNYGVMLVPSYNNEADWEAKMKAQQTKLIDATPNPKS